MSDNTTSTAKRTMDCARVAGEEILETYLAGRLTAQDREAFEEHYFECAQCFDQLRTLQTIRDVLPTVASETQATPTSSSKRWIPALGLAAAAVVTVGLALMMRQPPVTPATSSTSAAPSSKADLPPAPAPQLPHPPAPVEPSLEQLARVEPPRYEPLRLRGATDEATARFQRGMERYRKGDYGGATDNLRIAANLEPDGIHILFYLGISHLMLGQDEAAVTRLRATIARGDSAYLEEAHWYLAKAFLRRKDLGAAESHLNAVIQLRGSKSGEAQRLLTQVATIRTRSD